MSKVCNGLSALVILGIALTANLLNAQMFSDAWVRNEGITYRGGLSISSVDYKISEFGVAKDIDRKIIFGEISSPMQPNLNLFGQGGFIFDSDLEDSKGGFIFGGGVKSKLFEPNPNMIVNGYGMLNYYTEKGEGDASVSVLDLHLGGIAFFATLNPNILPYGGLELIPMSSGKIKVSSVSIDIKRDSIFNLKGGIIFALEQFKIGLDLILIGEQTISVSIISQ